PTGSVNVPVPGCAVVRHGSADPVAVGAGSPRQDCRVAQGAPGDQPGPGGPAAPQPGTTQTGRRSRAPGGRTPGRVGAPATATARPAGAAGTGTARPGATGARPAGGG